MNTYTIHASFLSFAILFCAETGVSQSPPESAETSTQQMHDQSQRETEQSDSDVRSVNLKQLAGLANRTTSADIGEALAAEWYRVEVALIHRMVNVSFGEARTSIPPRYAGRFIAFTEGRLNVVSPFWCARTCCIAVYLTMGFSYFLPGSTLPGTRRRLNKSLKVVICRRWEYR